MRRETTREELLAMCKQELLSLIEQKRTELIQVAMKSGLNSSAAIQYSQELDALLNEYNRIFIKKVQTH
jgi:stage 0 sporulation regulatory protein